MILDNLFYNGQADAAASGGGVSRCVRPVKAVKNIGQVLCGNSDSVILNLNLNKISDILDAHVDPAVRLVQIFDLREEEVSQEKIMYYATGGHAGGHEK